MFRNAVANSYKKYNGGDDIQYDSADRCTWILFMLKFGFLLGSGIKMWWASFLFPTFGIVHLDLGQSSNNQKMLSDTSFAMTWNDCEWFHSISTDQLTARMSFLTLRTSWWISQKMAKHWVALESWMNILLICRDECFLSMLTKSLTVVWTIAALLNPN